MSNRGGAIWGEEMAPPKFTHTNIVFCLCINPFFVDAFGALLVWLSFGLALKYGICEVCGTLSCTHLPTKLGVGRLLPPLHILIIKHGHTLEWRTCNWVT